MAGNFLAGAGAARSPRTTLLVIGTVLALTVAALPLLGGSPALAAVLMVLWGLGYGGVSVSTQTWVLLTAPGAREAASSLFVGVFNAAIALGGAGRRAGGGRRRRHGGHGDGRGARGGCAGDHDARAGPRSRPRQTMKPYEGQCGSVAGLPPFASYPATASAR